tara:strand:+ start:145 stop:543 length:399 start_codon:yes stop_codon:yes gene_type:complete
MSTKENIAKRIASIQKRIQRERDRIPSINKQVAQTQSEKSSAEDKKQKEIFTRKLKALKKQKANAQKIITFMAKQVKQLQAQKAKAKSSAKGKKPIKPKKPKAQTNKPPSMQGGNKGSVKTTPVDSVAPTKK